MRASPLLQLIGAIAWCLMLPQFAQAADPTGIWLTQQGDARVRVTRCGGALCGHIVWLKDPLDEGKPSTDKNNPNPALRTRRLIGIQLFLAMRPDGADQWRGRIYNSDDGKTYDGSVAIAGRGSLKVEGCVGVFCGAEMWTRVR